MNKTISYFHRKIEEKRNQKKSLVLNSLPLEILPIHCQNELFHIFHIICCKDGYFPLCNKRVRDTEELTKRDKACSITGHVID